MPQLKYLLYTDKVYHEQLGKLMDYPPQWMMPYDLYKSGYVEQNLVAVLVTIPESTEQNDVIEIELFHMGTDPRKRSDSHLSLKFTFVSSSLESFTRYCSFGTKGAIPKEGMITKLFQDSPYILQKSIYLIMHYLELKKVIKTEIFTFFYSVWPTVSKKSTVKEFLETIRPLLK